VVPPETGRLPANSYKSIDRLRRTGWCRRRPRLYRFT